jgi:hypothetical protein
MEFVRRRFFQDDEAVMQYHAPLADYVDGSRHGCAYCLSGCTTRRAADEPGMVIDMWSVLTKSVVSDGYGG